MSDDSSEVGEMKALISLKEQDLFEDIKKFLYQQGFFMGKRMKSVLSQWQRLCEKI